MIAETLDSGVVSVAAVSTLLVFVAGGAWWASATKGDIRSIAKDVGSLVRGQREHARALDEHKTETAAQTTELGHRVTRLEIERELAGDRTPVHGIPLDRPSTGKHDRLRGNTPQPRKHADSGDTDSGLR